MTEIKINTNMEITKLIDDRNSVHDFGLKPSDIVIFHIGGGFGDIGPIQTISVARPSNVVYFMFDANVEAMGSSFVVSSGPDGSKQYTFNECIGEYTGEVDFRVNVHRASSSALAGSPGAVNEDPMYSDVSTWGENVVLDHIEKMKITSLRDFINKVGVIPDALSMDIQGLEAAVLRGLGNYVKYINHFLTEIEFFEIYEGQGLFSDQQVVFTKNGVRLGEIYNPQIWHPGPREGGGFLTVGEASWFKQPQNFIDDNIDVGDFVTRGIRFAAISFAYNKISHARSLLNKMQEIDGTVKERCIALGYSDLANLVATVRVEQPTPILHDTVPKTVG